VDYLYLTGSLMRELKTNRLRRLLSILGVIIGTGAVIASLAVVEGGRDRLYMYLNRLGANVVILEDRYEQPITRILREEARGDRPQGQEPGMAGNGGARGPGDESPSRASQGLDTSGMAPTFADTLSAEDIEALKRRFPEALNVIPQLLSREAVGAPGERPVKAVVEGSTPEAAAARQLGVSSGRYLCAEDIQKGEKVCVLGSALARKIFRGREPLGRDVVAVGSRWKVVGVLEPKGSLMRYDYDQLMLVPLPALQERNGGKLINAVLIRARTAEGALQIRARILKEVLGCLHNRNEEDFSIFCPEELVQQKQQTLKTFRVLTASIASFSLLVSGIGIMNIMLVSVRERRREIGIWKAVGATNEDVMIYFLSESILTCVVGGILGILLGVFMADKTSNVIAGSMAEAEGWIPIFRPAFFLLATGAAALVGLVSGLFPAYLAAQLDPVEALRNE
jgi:putative ABC transport system permease protein